jgi:hypothetical protein
MRRKMNEKREEAGFKEVRAARREGLATSYNACSEGGGIE